MVTALTLYPLESQATGTLSTASNMASGTGGTTTTSVTTKGPSSNVHGFGQIYPLGTSQTWPALGTIGSPDGNGWLWDVTTLQGNTIAAGNWTPTITIASSLSCTADLHFRVYTYNTGTYTLQNEFILSAVSITGAQTAHAFSAASLSAISYGTGDKVYCDLWLNVTSDIGGVGAFALKCSNSVPATGGTTDNQLVTPGYSASATTVAKLFQLRGNVAQQSTQFFQMRGPVGHQSTKLFQMRGNITTARRLLFQLRGNVGKSTRLFQLRGNVGPLYHSPVDAHLYKQQQVLVYTPAGVFLDCWPDAPLLAGFKEAINAAISPMKVVLPRAFENYDGSNGRPSTISQGNLVKYYLFGPGLPSAGLLRYQGIIDSYEAQISDQDGGETVTVSLVPQSSAVADHTVTGQHSFGTSGSPSTYVDPITMFNWFFTTTDPTTGQKYAYPLTLDPSNPILSGVKNQFNFQDQTVGSCFSSIQLLLPPNWFYRCNVDNSVTLNVPPTTPQMTFTIGQDISNPQYAQSWQELKNVARVKGAATTSVSTRVNTDGTFNASTNTTINNKFTSNESASSSSSVSMNQAPTTANTVTVTTITATKTGSDIATYTGRGILYADNRITDQNTANAIAQGLLNALDQPILRAKIRLLDYRGDVQSGLGFDIETIKVGMTCQIIDVSQNDKKVTLWNGAIWDQSSWDYALGSAISTVAIITGLTYGYDYVDLEIGSMQPSQQSRVHSIQRRLEVFQML